MSSSKRGLQRFRDAENPRQQAQAWFEASQIAARQGNLEEARHLMRTAVQTDREYVEAWLQLAWLTKDERERNALLEQVLRLEPDHVQARAELARLQAGTLSIPTDEDRGVGGRLLVLALLVLAASVFLLAVLVWGPVDRSLAWLRATPAPSSTPTPTPSAAEIAAQFEPQLQAALSGEDWDRALEIAAIMLGVDPLGEGSHRSALAVHVRYGQALVKTGREEEALVQFDGAVALAPEDAEAQLWQQVTQLYLAGEEALVAEDWPTAIDALTQAHERLPNYGDLAARVIAAYRLQGQAAMEAGDWTLAIQSLALAHDRSSGDQALVNLLATSYRQRGIAWQEEGKLQKARADLEAALALTPDDEQAQAHYDEVMYILFPPKRIDIDISAQRFRAYEGDTLVFNLPTSTGLRGRDTATGHFQVQSKIPMAYSSIWRLKMPYWLGIYNVGNIENGIHALPIRPDGSVMWGGLLGQRASYGCVILSTEAARLVYDWAEIGTAVDIHY